MIGMTVREEHCTEVTGRKSDSGESLGEQRSGIVRAGVDQYRAPASEEMGVRDLQFPTVGRDVTLAGHGYLRSQVRGGCRRGIGVG
jgi:hypothetical protein